MYSIEPTKVANGSGTGSTGSLPPHRGDAIPKLELMLAPHIFELSSQSSPSWGGRL